MQKREKNMVTRPPKKKLLYDAPDIYFMVVSISSSQGIPLTGDKQFLVIHTTKALHYHIVVKDVVTQCEKKCGFIEKPGYFWVKTTFFSHK